MFAGMDGRPVALNTGSISTTLRNCGLDAGSIESVLRKMKIIFNYLYGRDKK